MLYENSVVSPFEKNCPIRPEKHGTDRPLRNHLIATRVAFVEAARFLGGHLSSLAKTNLTRYRKFRQIVTQITSNCNLVMLFEGVRPAAKPENDIRIRIGVPVRRRRMSVVKLKETKMTEKSAAAVQPAPSRPPVKAVSSESISERIESLYEAISRRAYELFERDGRVHGNDVSHWTEAEKEFLQPLTIKMEQTEEEIVLHAEVPGFTSSDLEVSVEPRRVTVSGKHESRNESKEGKLQYVEQRSDEIFRSLELPSEVNANKVSATLKDGVLKIVMPKVEPKTPAGSESQPS
jgi:HSP20 family protein